MSVCVPWSNPFLFKHMSAAVPQDVNKLACYQNGNEETSGDSSSQARKTNTIRSLSPVLFSFPLFVSSLPFFSLFFLLGLWLCVGSWAH